MGQETGTSPLPFNLLVLPESTPAALYGMYEVFSSVGVAWPELTGEPSAGPRIDVRLVGPSRRPVTCAMGARIIPHCSLDEAPQAAVSIVTDLGVQADSDPRGRWPKAAAWMLGQYRAGGIVCSVCTGSLLLAEAGLLDGREATTHWSAAGLFARWYPQVRLRPERILAPAGEGERIITSGGAASWEDLALYLIARHCGEAEAVRTAKVFVFGDRSEGQLPFAALRRSNRHEDAAIARCQTWIAEHYAGPSPVTRMVAESGLNERTFNRRFRAATGYAPVEYVQTLRIEEAKHLLETTGEATDGVARRVGYDDPAFFRRLFKRRTGVTPARYRQRFRLLPRTGERTRSPQV